MVKARFEFDPEKREFRRRGAGSPWTGGEPALGGTRDHEAPHEIDQMPIRRRRRRSASPETTPESPPARWTWRNAAMWAVVALMMAVWLAVILSQSLPADDAEKKPPFQFHHSPTLPQ
jgi:hypothetical protein